jgi:hypothetical protein
MAPLQMRVNMKPFDMGYVLKVTAKHMKRSIEISMNKTLARAPELVTDAEKSLELFSTLSVLQNMRKQIDDFQTKNSRTFKSPNIKEQ